MWLGPAPKRDYHSILSPRGVNKHFPQWRAYREYGGGGVTDWGAHHLDITHWGIDADRSGPTRITPPENWTSADFGVRLQYPNGIEVHHIKENGVTFFGSEGEVYVNRGKFQIKLRGTVHASAMSKEDKSALPAALDFAEKEYLSNAKVRLYASTDHKADFLASMVSRKQPITDVETGAHTVIGCHLISLAYYHGKTIKWDPARLVFEKGSGDERWLHNEYRGDWKLA
jgi:predicted dehydrogenase